MKYDEVIKDFARIFSLRFLALTVLIGIFLVWKDSSLLKKNQMEKESKVARWMGIMYIIVAFILYGGSLIIS